MALLEDKIAALERTLLLSADKAEQMRQTLLEKNAQLFSEVREFCLLFSFACFVCFLLV